MLAVKLICVGKMRERFFIDAFAEYAKRLQAYCKFECIELTEQRLSDNPSQNEIAAALAREAADIGRNIRADMRLSMSEMTFPHHLARVMLAEQIYRGFKINEGSKYHK